MEPILLIHGYSSEGENTSAEKIYGSLPAELRQRFPDTGVVDINLSRWISLSDGVGLDDISFAMQRALQALAAQQPGLLDDGFHVVIHSTGALVARNWIKNHSPKPSPILNLVHLAGANFGSGLAHVGRGQLSRWSRLIFQGTGRGTRVLDELEFGSSKTLDMHLHFLKPGENMRDDYGVQEFCIVGSQTLSVLRAVPIRYVKEDSADNTVRTSACNLNFNYVSIQHSEGAGLLGVAELKKMVNRRSRNLQIDEGFYLANFEGLADTRVEVPFAILFETAHFGKKTGIVSGSENREEVIPLVVAALTARPATSAADGLSDYEQTRIHYQQATEQTFARAAQLHGGITEWNPRAQYEGHAQIIFRLQDQFGDAVQHYDITFKSRVVKKALRLEDMIEDDHLNKYHPGTITFYLRTQRFDQDSGTWIELLEGITSLELEITATELDSDEIHYLPLLLSLSGDRVREVVQSFRTTIIDVTLLRLPSARVFKLSKSVA